MLDKLRSIKPTKLWYHTSLKAFRATIKDRYDAVKNLDARFHKPTQYLAFTGFIWATAMAFAYSFGLFAPEKVMQTVLPYECKSSSNTNLDLCKKEEKKQPTCPPVNKKGPC